MNRWIYSMAVLLTMAVTLPIWAQTTQPSAALSEEKLPGMVVVEVFTSEGCSSCPPADEYVKKLAKHFKEKGYRGYTLAWHVHYWDYIGWKDRFGSQAISQRQAKYAKVTGRKGQWTPHIAVNGKTYFGGKAIYQGIMKDLNQAAQGKLDIKSRATNNEKIMIDYTIMQAPAGSVLVVVLAEDKLSSKVSAGENKGKTLHHEGVVRSFVINDLEAANGTLTLEVPSDLKRDNAHVIAYLQHPKQMTIHNAIQIALPEIKNEAKASVEDQAVEELMTGFPDQTFAEDGSCEGGACVYEPGQKKEKEKSNKVAKHTKTSE